MARRVVHFNDPKLEAQFDEIVRSEGEVKQEVEERIDEVGEQLNHIYDPNDTTPPAAPVGLKAVEIFRAFLLEWETNEESDFDHYILEWASTDDDGETWTDWFRIPNIGKAVNHTHDGLNPRTGYRYRLYAVDSAKNVSAPSAVYLAGHPGKISLSEDIVGELAEQYIKDGAISLAKWSADLQQGKATWDSTFEEVFPNGNGTASTITQASDQIALVAAEVEDSKADIAVLAVKANEISGTVAEVQTNQQQTQTTVQQLSDSINMRLAVVDSNGIPIPLAQIAVSKVGEDGYIVLDASKVLVPRSLRAEVYEEIRNVLPYNYLDSLDATRPLVCDFYIPSETVRIISVKLSVKGLPYRAYAKSAPYKDDSPFWNTPVGEVTLTTQMSLAYEDRNTNGDTGEGIDQTHCNWDAQEDRTHFHIFKYPKILLSKIGHIHIYSRLKSILNLNTHRHYFDGSHGHKLEFGIYEDTPPSNVVLRLDNGQGFSTPTTRYYCGVPGVGLQKTIDNSIQLGNPDASGVLANELDLTAFFTGKGWKRIKFESATLGRINAQLILKVDITA